MLFSHEYNCSQVIFNKPFIFHSNKIFKNNFNLKLNNFSAYALPAVMAHAPLNEPIIKWSSAGFIFAGNTVIFATIFIFVRSIMSEENYGGW